MKFDVAIIGGGPAGLSAGIFTCNAGLKTICFEKLAIGGQASLSYEIANYPGLDIISGYDLSEKFLTHATNSGLELSYDKVKKITKTKYGFSVKTNDACYSVKKLIIAVGTKVRKLGLINEDKFIGRGVSYCASCDGRFFKNKVVAIVGGGDSAFEYVEYLSKIAKKVYLLNHSESFKASEYKVEKAKKHKNVSIITSAIVKSLKGESSLEKIELSVLGEEKSLKVDGLFVAIGHLPEDLSFLDFELKLDKNGYIKVDENQKTSVENVYACGDITSKLFKQVITACADGARAGNSCIGD